MIETPLDSLGAELRRAAAEVPNKPFIRMAAGEWTYGQFDEMTDQLAVGLRRQGVQRSENVSLMLPNCIEFAVAWFALSRLGAVAAPVNTSFRGAVLGNALNLVESRLLIVHTTLLASLTEIETDLDSITQVIVVGGGGVLPRVGALRYQAYTLLQDQGGPTEEPLQAVEVNSSELALLLYTSGTTGRSKAAMISHRFVLAQGRLMAEQLALTTSDVLYCPYPMFHLDAAVITIAPALVLRAVAAIGERFSVSRYWDEVRALGGTVFDFMGATLTMLWKQPASAKDRQHSARLGWGVPMPAWAPEFEARFGCRLVELYGLTEAGAVIFPPLDAPRRLGSCGKAVWPYDTRLLDEQGFEVPDGEPGELVIRPLEPSVIMDGYYGMPEATLAAFRNLWFHTGDVLKKDADGYLYFVGRRKDIVRRRGENISAAEVEMVIEEHPDVLECAIIGVPSDMTEEEVMACLVLRAGSSLSHEELAGFCAKRMARFMVPRYIRFLDVLPKTPTDKVEKFRLQEQGVTTDTWDRDRVVPPPVA
jgi:crotonobetaine/carnitine-CoA ligase